MVRRVLLSVSVALTLSLLPCQAGADAIDYEIETVAEGLAHPWSLTFLPDGRMLVTERAGRLRLIEDGELHPEPVAGIPEADIASQGGLFEVLPHPAFASNGWLYLSLAHGDTRANTTRVVRGRLSEHALVDTETLFDAEPARDTPVHYGGRMTFLPDGTFLLGLGDGFDYREAAQDPGNHLGSLVRLNADGSVPADNPFVNDPEKRSEIYSYGHRNIQGIVFDPETDTIWSHEHGPRGGDELNRIQPGANYGWPVATHGIDYSGARISPYRSRPGMVDPVHVWTPSIAPAGMTRYQGPAFPDWQGDLLVAALVAKAVIRVELEDGRVVATHRHFAEIDERIRDIKVGPDGALYVLTDSPNGRVFRIHPARKE